MPPKQPTGLPVRSSTRKGKGGGFPAETLSQVNLARARLIATQYSVANPEKYDLKDLLPQIRDRMSQVKQCSECANSQCIPESHVFPAYNPYVETDADGNPLHQPPSGGPDTHAMAALGTAPQPTDRIIQRGEDAPSFLDTLASLPGGPPAPPAAGGPAAPAISSVDNPGSQPGTSTSSAQLPGIQPGASVSPGNLVSPTRLFGSFNSPQNRSPSADSPGDSEVDSNAGSDEEEDEEANAAFQAQIQALKEKQAVELNTKKNALTSEASKKAKQQSRQKKKIQREKEKQAYRAKVIADLEKEHQAALLAAEKEFQQQVPHTDDDVFIDASHRSRLSRSDTPRKNRVSYAESPRSQSVRASNSPRGVDLADLVQIMDRQQAMMNEQHERTLSVVTSALQGLASTNRVPVSAIGDFGTVPSSGIDQAGRSQVIPAGNPDAAREHGFHPPINWGLQGELNNIDLNKIKKSMQSGKNRTGGEGIVIRQHYWPHDCLSKASRHILGKNVKIRHNNQTQTMFTEGFLQKLLIDTPKENMDPILNNKIKLFAMLTKLSYTVPWADILSISEDFFEAFEYDHISWDSWPVIERFVKDSYEQIRLSAISRPRSFSAPAGSGHGAGNSWGNPPKRPLPEDINGVPSAFMRKNYICVKFNAESCETQSSGDHKAGNATLHHWCGGCFKQSNGSTKAAHPAKSCPKGPFGNLFA